MNKLQSTEKDCEERATKMSLPALLKQNQLFLRQRVVSTQFQHLQVPCLYVALTITQRLILSDHFSFHSK